MLVNLPAGWVYLGFVLLFVLYNKNKSQACLYKEVHDLSSAYLPRSSPKLSLELLFSLHYTSLDQTLFLLISMPLFTPVILTVMLFPFLPTWWTPLLGTYISQLSLQRNLSWVLLTPSKQSYLLPSLIAQHTFYSLTFTFLSHCGNQPTS